VPYQVIVERWHDFYIVAGTAAATLVGLLFVGLALHLPVIVSRPDVRSLARITLANFGLTLFLSLFVLIRQASSALGTQLMAAGVVSLGIVAPSPGAAVRSRTRTLKTYQLLLRFVLSFVAYFGVILAGALIRATEETAGLGWLWVVTVVLLFVSLRNTWDLLVTVGAARTREADGR
jgi:hypothetical protein